MTRPQLTPPAGVLVATDVAKARNEVLIEVPGSSRRRRLSVLNRATAAAIPGARLVVYEGAPHAVPFTHAERLNGDLVDFLEA